MSKAVARFERTHGVRLLHRTTHSIALTDEGDRLVDAARTLLENLEKVEASLAEEYREILIATSDGKLVHDVQPLMRFGIRVIAEQNGRREQGYSGNAGCF